MRKRSDEIIKWSQLKEIISVVCRVNKIYQQSSIFLISAWKKIPAGGMTEMQVLYE